MKEAPYTRLCSTKKILTVNGKFPGPTLYAHKEETLIVDVYNRGKYNITIHWYESLFTCSFALFQNTHYVKKTR